EVTEFEPTNFKATIVCEKPNKLVYQTNGHIVYENGHIEGINGENMLLRGCKIRNTTFIEGIVLYAVAIRLVVLFYSSKSSSVKKLLIQIAGNDTKAMKNNSGVRYKRSSLELATNRFVLYCVAILLMMCIFSGIASTVWLYSFAPTIEMIIFIVMNTNSPLIDGVISMVSSVLTFQVIEI
ncbi:unnamed protein product, partial [Toxocara canis]|uniref:P-type phospholipid transporter n=1 Tax=Toxocara canis TaxID=6265 RepID=A0A183U9A8_TOXCA